MQSEVTSLRSIADTGDAKAFVIAYSAIRKKGVDIKHEATRLLSGLGTSAMEAVATMLNNNAYSHELRSTIANCLLGAIDFNVDAAKSKKIRRELMNAIDIGDAFISMNAAEALISIGVEDINGVPTRRYADEKRETRNLEDWNLLFGR